jgi:adenosine deaminase
LARYSIAHSFLRGETLWPSTRPFGVAEACAADDIGSASPSDACARFLQGSERAREQWRLERDLLAFERID